MSEMEVLKPLKTWSHLAKRRRKPSEYEIVSTNLLYNTRDPNAPYELDPNLFMNRWYKTYRDGSPVKHDDWNAFRDPDELVYRTYNMLQDGQETYVFGLFDQFNEREHDKRPKRELSDADARRRSRKKALKDDRKESERDAGRECENDEPFRFGMSFFFLHIKNEPRESWKEPEGNEKSHHNVILA